MQLIINGYCVRYDGDGYDDAGNKINPRNIMVGLLPYPDGTDLDKLIAHLRTRPHGGHTHFEYGEPVKGSRK